jgi:2-polyprenyl-3-methyl-5-hydroxy-6-metoxy-1,4-benzoquinol methylase
METGWELKGTRLHLAHHILLHPTRVFGAASSSSYPHLPPILELGAGTGFLSILLSQLGSDVVSTDLGEPDGVEAVGKQTPFRQLKGNVLLST